MKASPLALAAFLAVATSPSATAFTPSSFFWSSSSSNILSRRTSYESNVADLPLTSFDRTSLEMAPSGFLGMDEDDEDEDSDDEDDDDDVPLPRKLASKEGISPYTGLKLDPWDPNPVIKPRPGKYGFRDVEETVPDDQLAQTMSTDERAENLKIMRQIKKHDLEDLRQRRDHAGWVEANNDLKKRKKSDPWFDLNDRIKEAIQLGEDDQVSYLRTLIEKVGGPPPGIAIGSRGYAAHTEIFDIGMSPARASSMLEFEVRMQRAAEGRAMAAEFKKVKEKEQREWEEMMRNPGDREDKEAKARRESTMARIMGEIEEDRKKQRESAKEMLGKIPDTPESRTKSVDKAIGDAKKEMAQLAGRKSLTPRSSSSSSSSASSDDDGAPKTGAAKAREAAAAESAGGRPRLPGDPDVTRGELTVPVESSSTTVTGPVQVEVSSSYNTEQSDPPMRKHCFQYTIRITNNSETDTVQLLSRRFEIQTVGSSMKDVVQGEGVTGRQPVLKPGEVFEYTSTAPLSVRPIGTTIIAARMRGEYRYVTLPEGQETATEEQVKSGGDAAAELGTFHFVFPPEQRVQPVRSAEEEDDDDEEDEDDDDVPEPAKSAATATASSAPAAAAAPSRPASTPSASPASTLPGDADMTSGDVSSPFSDSSEALTDGVRVQVTSSYRTERSDAKLDKHCFAYNIRITNESSGDVQLVSRRFEIQTIGSPNKDVVQGPGVTGRQPILKPGESFEYTSTAPLSVKPMLEKTPVVARMEGEYNFVKLGEDGKTPTTSNPLQAKLGMFHFILPALDLA